ncbi:MAG: sigma-70 family RNA polymerase sigma factor [Candidatus Hydrogenedentota bacterium]
METKDVSNLIRRCIEGDDAARAELHAEYSGLIRRAVIRKLVRLGAGNCVGNDANDIVQEVFLRLLADGCRPLRQLRDPQCIDAWLMTVAQNHTVSYLRKNSVFNPVVQCSRDPSRESYDYTPADNLAANETRQIAADAFSKLTDAEKLALRLYYEQSAKLSDIAMMTGESINTVASRIRRAKLRILRLVQEQTVDG